MDGLALPLSSAFLAFLGGLLFGLRVPQAPAWIAFGAVPLLLFLVFHARLTGERVRVETARVLLLAAMALAGAGHGAGGRLGAAADCRAVLRDGAAVRVDGVLAATFLPPRDPAARWPLVPLRAATVLADGRPVARCEVEVRVRLPRGTPPLAAGTEVAAGGDWRLMPAPVTPSAWPRSPAYLGFVAVDSARVTAAPALARHPLLALRGRSELQLHRLFPRHGALADALLLGRRESLDRALADRFAQSGLVHLLAISGTHVALVGAVFVLLGRVFRLSRARVAALTVFLVALYLAVIGAPPSALRSGIMMALSLCAVALQRPSAPLPIMAAAALVLLAVDPMAALDAGFQLSFAGILGIFLLRGAMLRRVPAAWREGKARAALAESLVVSVSAFLATAPIVAHHFGQVAPVSILANLPAIPLTSLALIGIGAACAAEPILPPLAHLLADGAGAMLDLLNRVVDVAVAVPGGHAAVARPQWPLWAAAGLAFLLALDAAGRKRARVRWTVAAATACAAFLLLPLAAGAAGGALEIAFLDVGQGDAIALRTPAGRWLLVDAGLIDDGYDAGARRVLPFLRARGATRIEAMVLTHPHSDHVGGAAAVMRGMAVGRVIEPGLPFGSPVYEDVLEVAETRHVAWNAARQDRSLRIDGLELTFLWPTVDVLDGSPDANDISAVLRVRYGAFTALLTGDAPAEVEHRLVARYGAGVRASVLKAGHHGSRTASSPEFLDAVRPALVVVSCGRRNRYGHPAPEVMARLRARGIAVARTDQEGTVVIRAEADGEWEREGP